MTSLYRLISPLLISLYGLLARTVLSGKLRETWTIRWRLKSGKPEHAFKDLDRAAIGENPIWIHAASGEFEYAKSVIRALVAAGETDIVVSYFSPTYAENIRRFPGVKASFPLPFDRYDWMLELTKWLKPRCLLIARTDAWPMLVDAAVDSKVQTLLFSATFHAGSKRMAPWARGLTSATLSKINEIHCVSADDASLLRKLGAQHVHVAGDSRYDQVLARLENPKPIPEKLRCALHPTVFVAGSIWDEDVPPVLEASSGKGLTTILVPHEPNEKHLSFIEARLSSMPRVTFARLSKLSEPTAPLDYVLVDSVGLLAELYTLGQIGFVGGSFRGSVHSVMEPLAAGCITLVGPDHLNNREAIEFQTIQVAANECSAVLAGQSASDLQIKLKLAIETLKSSSRINETITEEVRRRGGATASVISWIKAQRN